MFDFTKEHFKVSGTTAEEARWLTCADISESFFPMPVGSLFVEYYFSEESKKAVRFRIILIKLKNDLVLTEY